MSEKCPKCGAMQVNDIDNAKTYDKMCCCCGFMVASINKQDYVSKFECPDCGSLSGTLEENDFKLGVRCSNCGKLHIMLEKHTTINNRNSAPDQNANTNINVPKCPHCNSINIKPISTGERIGSIVTLGIFIKKINKSFKCLECKYTW